MAAVALIACGANVDGGAIILVAGVALAIAQSLSLGRARSAAVLWVGMTLVGFTFAFPMAVIAGFLFGGLFAWAGHAADAPAIGLVIFAAAVAGAILGLLQSTALPGRLPNPRWIAANTIAAVPMIPFAAYGIEGACPGTAATLVLGAASGAVHGAITSSALGEAWPT